MDDRETRSTNHEVWATTICSTVLRHPRATCTRRICLAPCRVCTYALVILHTGWLLAGGMHVMAEGIAEGRRGRTQGSDANGGQRESRGFQAGGGAHRPAASRRGVGHVLDGEAVDAVPLVGGVGKALALKHVACGRRAGWQGGREGGGAQQARGQAATRCCTAQHSTGVECKLLCRPLCAPDGAPRARAPRCPPQLLHRISTRRMPMLMSSRCSTEPGMKS